MTTREIILGVFSIISAAMAVIFAKFGSEMEKKALSTPTTIDDQVLKFARIGVKYADEYFNGSSNETKKKMATLETLKQLGDAGVKSVSDKVLGQAVEMAVKETREAKK